MLNNSPFLGIVKTVGSAIFEQLNFNITDSNAHQVFNNYGTQSLVINGKEDGTNSINISNVNIPNTSTSTQNIFSVGEYNGTTPGTTASRGNIFVNNMDINIDNVTATNFHVLFTNGGGLIELNGSFDKTNLLKATNITSTTGFVSFIDNNLSQGTININHMDIYLGQSTSNSTLSSLGDITGFYNAGLMNIVGNDAGTNLIQFVENRADRNSITGILNMNADSNNATAGKARFQNMSIDISRNSVGINQSSPTFSDMFGIKNTGAYSILDIIGHMNGENYIKISDNVIVPGNTRGRYFYGIFNDSSGRLNIDNMDIEISGNSSGSGSVNSYAIYNSGNNMRIFGSEEKENTLLIKDNSSVVSNATFAALYNSRQLDIVNMNIAIVDNTTNTSIIQKSLVYNTGTLIIERGNENFYSMLFEGNKSFTPGANAYYLYSSGNFRTSGMDIIFKDNETTGISNYITSAGTTNILGYQRSDGVTQNFLHLTGDSSNTANFISNNVGSGALTISNMVIDVTGNYSKMLNVISNNKTGTISSTDTTWGDKYYINVSNNGDDVNKVNYSIFNNSGTASNFNVRNMTVNVSENKGDINSSTANFVVNNTGGKITFTGIANGINGNSIIYDKNEGGNAIIFSSMNSTANTTLNNMNVNITNNTIGYSLYGILNYAGTTNVSATASNRSFWMNRNEILNGNLYGIYNTSGTTNFNNMTFLVQLNKSLNGEINAINAGAGKVSIVSNQPSSYTLNVHSNEAKSLSVIKPTNNNAEVEIDRVQVFVINNIIEDNAYIINNAYGGKVTMKSSTGGPYITAYGNNINNGNFYSIYNDSLSSTNISDFYFRLYDNTLSQTSGELYLINNLSGAVNISGNFKNTAVYNNTAKEMSIINADSADANIDIKNLSFNSYENTTADNFYGIKATDAAKITFSEYTGYPNSGFVINNNTSQNESVYGIYNDNAEIDLSTYSFIYTNNKSANEAAAIMNNGKTTLNGNTNGANYITISGNESGDKFYGIYNSATSDLELSNISFEFSNNKSTDIYGISTFKDLTIKGTTGTTSNYFIVKDNITNGIFRPIDADNLNVTLQNLDIQISGNKGGAGSYALYSKGTDGELNITGKTAKNSLIIKDNVDMAGLTILDDGTANIKNMNISIENNDFTHITDGEANFNNSNIIMNDDSTAFIAENGTAKFDFTNTNVIVQDGLLLDAKNTSTTSFDTNKSVINGKIQTEAGSTTNVNLTNKSVWDNVNGSNISYLINDHSEINLRSTLPNTFNSFVVNEYKGVNGTIKMNTHVYDDSSSSDMLIIDGGKASGTTYLDIIDVSNGDGGDHLNGIKVVDAINGATTDRNSFKLVNDQVDTSAYVYYLFKGDFEGNDNESYYLRNQYRLTDTAKIMANEPITILSLTKTGMNTLHKRLGELRENSAENIQGVWARSYAKDLKIKDKLSTKMNIFGVEGGYDHRWDYDNFKIYGGVNVAYMYINNVKNKHSTGVKDGNGNVLLLVLVHMQQFYIKVVGLLMLL